MSIVDACVLVVCSGAVGPFRGCADGMDGAGRHRPESRYRYGRCVAARAGEGWRRACHLPEKGSPALPGFMGGPSLSDPVRPLRPRLQRFSAAKPRTYGRWCPMHAPSRRWRRPIGPGRERRWPAAVGSDLVAGAGPVRHPATDAAVSLPTYSAARCRPTCASGESSFWLSFAHAGWPGVRSSGTGRSWPGDGTDARPAAGSVGSSSDVSQSGGSSLRVTRRSVNQSSNSSGRRICWSAARSTESSGAVLVTMGAPSDRTGSWSMMLGPPGLNRGGGLPPRRG